jgi:hypothetical protein
MSVYHGKMKLYSVYMFIYAYDSEIIHMTCGITNIQCDRKCNNHIYKCAPPKGRAGCTLVG